MRRSPVPRAAALRKRRTTSSAPAVSPVRKAIETALGVEGHSSAVHTQKQSPSPSAAPPALARAPVGAEPEQAYLTRPLQRANRVVLKARQQAEVDAVQAAMAILANPDEVWADALTKVRVGDIALIPAEGGLTLKFLRTESGWDYEGLK